MSKKVINKIFDSLDKHYVNLLEMAKNKILSARIRTAKLACQEQIKLYYWLGEHIVTAQEAHGWGKAVVEQLSVDLKQVFKGTTVGFSPQNLWYMRQFYLEYRNYPNLQRLVGEIGWGQNIAIMSKVKDIETR